MKRCQIMDHHIRLFIYLFEKEAKLILKKK